MRSYANKWNAWLKTVEDNNLVKANKDRVNSLGKDKDRVRVRDKDRVRDKGRDKGRVKVKDKAANEQVVTTKAAVVADRSAIVSKVPAEIALVAMASQL